MITTSFKHIFIVDDDPFFLSLLEKLCIPFSDSPISLFNNGTDCLDALSAEPEVILLDYSMENMNGIEVIRHIKRTHPEIEVVFISSQEEVDVAVDSLKLGAAEYLIKDDDLANNLEEILTKLYTRAEINFTEKKAISSKRNTRLNENKISPKPLAFIKWKNFLGGILMLLFFQSCTTYNLFETPEIKTQNTYPFSNSNAYEYHVRKDDKISISIWNHNDLSVGSIFDVTPGNEEFGKWVMVDPFGNIAVPFIGEIKAEGCTIHQLENLLKDSFDTTIKDPIIIVKVLNKEVSILGEVRTPGTFRIDKEKTTISEIIAMAGGLDVYADQKQVKIIRKEETGTQQYQFDLTRMDDFDKANLVVLPGDVINVPSRKGKMFDRKIPTITPFISAISVIVLIYSLVLKK